MSITPWTLKGISYGNCNCDYGCPCQFNALPTDGTCKGFIMNRIDEGHFGDVSLDGLYFGFVMEFPGAIHEGNGTHQAIVDVRATPVQQAALLQIVRGESTEEMATHFFVYSTMSDKHLEPIVADIDMAIDMDARTASIKVGDLVVSNCEPIRNPVTGDEHRAQITLPEGFEYTVAEMGSGSTKSSAGVALSLDASYAQINEMHMTQAGIVR